MLAHGIRSYHRPTRVEDALDLAARGLTPLAGGSRLLARSGELPNVMDLAGLGWNHIRMQSDSLILGANVTLQEVMDSAQVYAATGGLLREACRAQAPSPLVRNMATLGGESVWAAHDSEVVAALLALNAVYRLVRPSGTLEVPALRFLHDTARDLAGSALVSEIVIAGPAPQGAALERVAVLPSAPPILALAASLSFAGDVCTRARLALTGLSGAPARVLEAEKRLEGTRVEDGPLAKATAEVLERVEFRGDAHAPASYRKDVVATLLRRAVRKALERRSRPPVEARLPPATRTRRPAPGVPYFTSGRVDLVVNGRPHAATCDARTTLLDLLRREGFWSVKHGCETGECGACAVLLDGAPVAACMTLALRAHGHSVQTAEGLGTPDALHPLQAAFVETGAIQCGYCTPAMELCATALLDAVPDPTEEEVRDALAGCLCRCTGYVKPVQAVLQAARQAKEKR